MPPSPAAPAAAPPPAAPRAGGGPVPATPSTRRLARELGVNLNTVAGSGPNGRITDEDVRAAAGAGASPAAVEATPAGAAAPAPAPAVAKPLAALGTEAPP